MDDLLGRQDSLQKEARRQLTELELLTLLSPFGDVIVVGSVITGLMTWPDIDLEVIGKHIPTKEAVGEIAKKLFTNQDIFRVWMMDNREKSDIHQPAGLYVGAKRHVGSEVWKFDIWFLKDGDQRSGKDDLGWVKAGLTPERRNIILSIKDQISDDPMYRKTIFSFDIYKAVLEEGIEDIDGFKEYLKRSDRSLTR